MPSANWDEEAIGKYLLRSAGVANLEQIIKEPLEEIITTLWAVDNILLSELVYATMPLIFTHIDLLGYSYTGDPSPRHSSTNAVKFLREYLGRVDSRYKEVGGLLHHALRHGWIHKVTSKRLKLQNGIILDFSFIFTGQRADHLKVQKGQERWEELEIYGLSVSLRFLCEDLLSAIDSYAKDLRHNQALFDIFKDAFKTRRKPEEEKELLTGRNTYIQNSDFAFVREQISNL